MGKKEREKQGQDIGLRVQLPSDEAIALVNILGPLPSPASCMHAMEAPGVKAQHLDTWHRKGDRC